MAFKGWRSKKGKKEGEDESNQTNKSNKTPFPLVTPSKTSNKGSTGNDGDDDSELGSDMDIKGSFLLTHRPVNPISNQSKPNQDPGKTESLQSKQRKASVINPLEGGELDLEYIFSNLVKAKFPVTSS